MKNLKFKYCRAENFLCFGPEGIEIDFENLGNIVLIEGRNLDVDVVASSNGSGKSSIIDAPVYALFGKTVKKPKKLGHTDVINNQSDKALQVELIWDEYRVVRTRKGSTGTLRLWKSDKGVWDKTTEITLGGMPATQKCIEEIIGLTYEAFINIYVFSDDPTVAFLESDGPTKREIVENLLSLDKYRVHYESAKSLTKERKDKVKNITKEYDQLIEEVKACDARKAKICEQEKEWLKTKKVELDKILLLIKSKRDEIDNTDLGAALVEYREAQEQISELNKSIPTIEVKIEKYSNAITEILPKHNQTQEKFTKLSNEFLETKTIVEEYEDTLTKNQKAVNDINQKSGKNCPTCLGVINPKNFSKVLEKAQDTISELSEKLIPLKERQTELAEELTTLKQTKDKIELLSAKAQKCLNEAKKELSETHSAISRLSKIKEPQASARELLLEQQLEELKSQADKKQKEITGTSPFEEIKQSSEKEYLDKTKLLQDKRTELNKAEKELPYFEYWVKAFGDTGIRKYVIDGIVPELNSEVAYWLQFLIDNKIKLVFDNELKETIDRYPFKGRPYVYHGMSGGQRRRLNLTVSQAFAHIMMLNCGASPSVVFLDEVTMNMDTIGVEGIYRMICELSKQKQVFVIDHNQDLLQMLEGCDKIKIEMRNEIAKIVAV